jgi:hypothetical protein
VSKWISVKDQMPEPNVRVLCTVRVGSMTPETHLIVGYQRGSGSKPWSCEGDWRVVTHWMPLPEPPA